MMALFYTQTTQSANNVYADTRSSYFNAEDYKRKSISRSRLSSVNIKVEIYKKNRTCGSNFKDTV